MSAELSLTTITRRVALSMVFALSTATTTLAQEATRDGYYASIGNPHPELSGFPKVRWSDVRIYANQFDPHPEITMPGVGVFAGTEGGAPLKPRTTPPTAQQGKLLPK